MSKRIPLLLTALLVLGSAWSQRTCGSMDVLEAQLEEDPKRAVKMEQIEDHLRDLELSGSREVNGVVAIPVVVHVLYNTTSENISDAQILSQITVLNDDFRRTNSDADETWSQAADSEIEFCMASSDPEGNATNGIVRTATSVSAFGTNDAMKSSSSGGADAWPAGDYLNVWVCDISGGILGYAQFPGGAASTDGIVIDYQYFGTIGTASAPFDLGRTATHEVGHWLNLRHIWGDGNCNADDFVTDTPSSDGANYGCATGHVSCQTTDMVENYMDYSDDACMNLYTAGQKNRMRALFESGGYRASLLNSSGCGPVTPATCDDGIQNGDETGVDCGGADCAPCTCDGVEVTVTVNFDNYPEETSWEISSGNTTVFNGGTYPNAPDGSTSSFSQCLADGCYTFTMSDSYGDGLCCSYGTGSYTVSDESDNILASGASFGGSESTDFCVTSVGGPEPTCEDGEQNGDETGVDCGGADCPACATCDDGIQNGTETGVDCGGSCTACATCDDGIQNGTETGVDCGGSCAACATCDDGIQNGTETGVDCGGSCTACVTCDDGIQNGTETGVDCGGSCAACATCDDGIQNGTETGVDCGGSCAACVTCDDGIQNGTETGVDCGGSCTACATCDDGIQNGTETGVDCGGSCTACATCDDGIQNGTETGVDCGGSCTACATCDDGIQNGTETGVDCGGSDCSPCESLPCTYGTVDSESFESGWGIWNDGGSDCRRNRRDRNYANGTYAIRLRDNTSTSNMTTDNLNLSGYEELTVSFDFIASSMENNEDFWLQISLDGGSSYTTVATYVSGSSFSNNQNYTSEVLIPGPFTDNTRVRFRCDASGNNDKVYLDDVLITGCVEGGRWGQVIVPSGDANSETTEMIPDVFTMMNVYPNPADDVVNVSFVLQSDATYQWWVTDIQGRIVWNETRTASQGEQKLKLQTSSMQAGTYLMHLISNQGKSSKRFIISR